MLIFIKKDNEIIYYLVGFYYFGLPIGSTNYDESLHFNFINYDMLSLLRFSGYYPSWELD